MIFHYDELKEYVKEDFEQFYQMGFSEKQIFPAVLDEYKYGKGFCRVENICIHIFLILNYAEKELNFEEVSRNLKQLITEDFEDAIKSELGNEYTKYIADLDRIKEEINIDNSYGGAYGVR